MRKKGFTLVELLAVIVILGIILAIAVPSILGLIDNTKRSAFGNDAKRVIKAIEYRMLETSDFNPAELTLPELGEELKLSVENYEDIQVEINNRIITITIVGKNIWAGLTAYGTLTNMIVVNTGDLDVTPPIITILGDNPVSINQGTVYNDAGATALDNVDGDITYRISVSNNVINNTPGVYTVTYTVSDNAENQTTAIRTVYVIVSIAFNYTGGVQTWTVPITARYKLEVWGAQGGKSLYDADGGNGGYAWGEIILNAGDLIRIYVGQKPTTATGGWNGGGSRISGSWGAGGGATDIRRGGTALTDRIIVAGGGGGSYDNGWDIWDQGGAGGGLNGGDAISMAWNEYTNEEWETIHYGTGGTQVAGGQGTISGSFGQGASASANMQTAGGGGWYGGGISSGSGYDGISVGGGGSSYIGGMIDDATRGTTTGIRTGHGFARITSVSY
jgi:prepilin-type N-terminal cleavage/methylation domain-containing protein